MKIEPTKLNPQSFRRNSVKNRNIGKRISRRGFCNLSVPLFISFWCVVVLFHAKLGLTRGNEENGYENITGGVVMEPNVSEIINDSASHEGHTDLEGLFMETSESEELISVILVYESYMCRIDSEEDGRESEPGQQQNGRIQITYPNLDEFKYISRQEKSGSPRQLENITHRLEPDGTPYNYASAAKGAKVVDHNKEAKGTSNILGKDHDKYLRNPCSVGGKYFIIELVDETLVDAVKIANFEHYSSNFKDFELYGTLVYPTETWNKLGSFVAANIKQTQCFKLPEPKWVRYLKVNLLSHYGSEFYCTLSVVEVYGVDAVEQMLEDLIVTSKESSTNGSPSPNSTAVPSLLPEPGPNNPKVDDVAHNVSESASKGVGNIDEGQKLSSDILKGPKPVSSTADPMLKARQHAGNRWHADAALKVVLQKVRALEQNLSVLEEYIKELNKRRGDILPELDKELAKFSVLLEKSKSEMRDLLEWKETMEKGLFELESWRALVSTQMDLLVTQNSMLRVEVEKVLHDQASLASKELAILTVTLSFACIAILKIISGRVVEYFRSPTAGAVPSSSSVWTLILIFCSMTMIIPVIYG
ncbi:SUN domain-containing protein 2 [Sesamum indicum]|uniref:SUN domain-containing protein 2 n=1 Tax=Sesamum indicum TaxID=4182 RepID=A0A6I9TEN7_SESIN|nr:SUN domain-containing protein 2 [Sesamum indicum]